MKQPNCACRSPDARTCFELRYYGHSPVDPDDDQDEQCECGCHIRDQDGRDEWDDEHEGWDRDLDFGVWS